MDKNEAMSVVAGGSAAGCSSGGSSSHYRPESASGHKSDKSDKEKEKKEREREEKDIGKLKRSLDLQLKCLITKILCFSF